MMSWRLKEEFQSLCLTHTLPQPLSCGQPPNDSSLQSTVPASVRSFALVERSVERPTSLPAVLLMETPSPQAPSESGSAFIDAALPLDEPVQRFRIQLVLGPVPHEA